MPLSEVDKAVSRLGALGRGQAITLILLEVLLGTWNLVPKNRI